MFIKTFRFLFFLVLAVPSLFADPFFEIDRCMRSASELQKSFAIETCQDSARKESWSNAEFQRCVQENANQELNPRVRAHCVERERDTGSKNLCDLTPDDLRGGAIAGVNYNSPDGVVSAIKEFCGKDQGETVERDEEDDKKPSATDDSKAKLASAKDGLSEVLAKVQEIQAESDAWVDLARGVVGRNRKAKELAQASYDGIPANNRTSSFEGRYGSVIKALTGTEASYRRSSGVLRTIKKLNNQISDNRSDIILLNRCLRGVEQSQSQPEAGYFDQLQAAQQKYLGEAQKDLESIRRTQGALNDKPSRKVIGENLESIESIQRRSSEIDSYPLDKARDEHNQCDRVLQGQQGPVESDEEVLISYNKISR